MELDGATAAPVARLTRKPAWLAPPGAPDPGTAVAALYRDHALALTRLAHIMLGSRAAAEDVVQDAFCALYRRWEDLASKENAAAYVRSSVLNGCRTALRGRARLGGDVEQNQQQVLSAEAVALLTEERRDVVRALWRLPERQREVLVLRYYLDLPDEQVAADLGLTQSTIRSIRRRGLSALKRSIREMS